MYKVFPFVPSRISSEVIGILQHAFPQTSGEIIVIDTERALVTVHCIHWNCNQKQSCLCMGTDYCSCNVTKLSQKIFLHW